MADETNESVKDIEATLSKVDDALERLRLGTYRTCQECGAPIDDTSLVNDPLLATCQDHLGIA